MARAQLPSFYASGVDYAAYATPQDMIVLENPVGSGKTIRVVNFRMNLASTAAALARVNFLRRSALNAGGTSATVAAAKQDSGTADPVGVVRTYSVVPATPGASDGVLQIARTATTVLTAAGTTFQLNPGNFNIATVETFLSPLVLRPGQCLAANFNGAALPAGFNTQSWDVLWTESDIGS